MTNAKSKSRLQWMTIAALLTALIFLFTFTGIGYIPVGPLTLTILTLPVAVGACLLGPWGGLFLGAMFGLSSFLTCFGIDATGTLLLGENAFFTFITCMVPRLLCGFLPALLFRALDKRDRSHIFSASLSCLAVAVLNTVLFLSCMWLFFSDVWTGQGFQNIWLFFVACAGVNALVEAASNLFIGGAIVKALLAVQKRMTV